MSSTSPNPVWPVVHEPDGLREILIEKAPAVFEVLAKDETSWGLRLNLLEVSSTSVIATAKASWIETFQGRLRHKSLRDLSLFELRGLAQIAAAQRLPATFAQFLPRELPDHQVAQRFGVTITREGIIFHAEDYRRYARHITAWRDAFGLHSSHAQPVRHEAQAPHCADSRRADPAASGAVSTFVPFSPRSTSAHDRLRSAQSIIELLSSHIALYSELLPQEAQLCLAPQWSP